MADQLKRDTENGMLGGVCAGIANHFSMDPIIVRMLFVVGAILWGFSIWIYILLWILLPTEK